MLKCQKIKLDKLTPNIGQIPGLPMNPRKWSDEDVERIAKSLRETPELFEARPIIAVPFDGANVILGGNLRFEGATKNGDKDAPVVLLPADTPLDKLKEIVIKDNGTFGQWDTDALLKEWNNGILPDWGVPARLVGTIPAGDVNLDGLFDPTKKVEQKPKPTILQVETPVDLAERVDNIRAAIVIALEEFPGCKVL